jgi:aspartate aminotransferase
MAELGLETDADLVKLLLKKGDVVLVPGTPFGAPGYVRLSFACSLEELESAVERIKSALV